ncbi:hypothetical protein HII17_00785 [Thalassotalea sp. M1531]|uniref:Uncharacterized protein n=1 Tax=Thalassotalea algicola TaxID=2716224 RepID=A0A7Y0L959_9GAMM|nr:hypothetical protein [Thalassotalea algicola]NMP30082.1 hypothetical protein [Thalassotalea algicola]
MKCRFSSFIALAFLAGCGSTSSNTAPKATTNIASLNFYPDCEFTIVDTIKVHSGIVNKDLSPADKKNFQFSEQYNQTVGSPKLTYGKLQQRAKRNDVDAVAIIDYFVDKGTIRLTKGKNVYGEKHTMRAELIKFYNCPANKVNDPRGKLVKFNRQGERNFRDTSNVVAEFDQLHIIENEQTDQVLTNNIVVNEQVLGFGFETTKNQLASVLGAPSAMIKTKQGNLVFLYGRKYLFMFKGDELIGFEHARKILPTHLSNRVSFNEEFEELAPQMNQQVSLGDNANKVLTALSLNADQFKKHLVSIKGNELTTYLRFGKSHRYAKQLKDFELAGIAMYRKGVKPFNWQAIAQTKKKVSYIDMERSFLGKGNAIDRATVAAALGTPDLKILKSDIKEVWAYGNELIFDFYRGHLSKYRFESVSKNKAQSCVKCIYLGQAKIDLPSKYITRRSESQYTLENKQFSYLVEFSNEQKVDDIEVFIKQ